MTAATHPLRRWLCEACGLIYDEAKGDPDSGLAPGTRFEDIPEDWRCPICGVGKADFRPIAPAPSRAPGASAPCPGGPRGEGVVVVGAGTAGWSVVRALRDAGCDAPVTLVTACDGALYPKPSLSVALARGQTPAALIERPGAALAAELGVRLLAHTWALELDVRRQRLTTTRGTLRFSHLVLATGGRARRPALPGPGAARLFAVNDLAGYARLRAAWDAACVRAAAQGRTPRLAVLGAGLVGCELADDFAGAGAAVSLLEAQALPLAGRLDEATAARLVDALRGRGVRFHGGAVLQEAGLPPATDGDRAADPDDTGVTLSWRDTAGATVAECFDVGLAAVGVEPETRLARRAGLAVRAGIVVDDATLACVPDRIWALGDCAEVGGRVGGTVEPILRQARTIAGAIVGRTERYVARDPVWVVKTACLPLTIRPGVAERAG
jgi:rubredoxin-NAD+ reductase